MLTIRFQLRWGQSKNGSVVTGSSRRWAVDRGSKQLSFRLVLATCMVATALTGAGVAVSSQGLAAAATSASGTSTISLYPQPAQAGPWEWYRSCLFLPSVKIPPSGGCQGADPVFGPMVLNGDLWNLSKTADGGVAMHNTASGALGVYANFQKAGTASPSTWVIGYPNISYGIAPQSAADSPKPSASLPLPMKLSTVPNLLGTTNYQVSGTSDTRFDFSYDMWLEPQKAVDRPTTGTLEVMVWMDSANDALPPDYRETVPMEYAVNGVAKSGKWAVYLPVGKTSGTTTVVLALTKRMDRASFAVELTTAIQQAEAALKKYDPTEWPSLSNYYLDSISLGSEFGQKPGSSSAGPFSWGLFLYRLGVGMKLP